MWVKSTIFVPYQPRNQLRDLVSDDPAHPEDKSWCNGEPDEVESEWDLLKQNSVKAAMEEVEERWWWRRGRRRRWWRGPLVVAGRAGRFEPRG